MSPSSIDPCEGTWGYESDELIPMSRCDVLASLQVREHIR